MEDDEAFPEWFRRSLRDSLGEEDGRRMLDFLKRARLRQNALRELAADSDRCVGIVAPAFVEEELKLCVKRHFVVPGNSKLSCQLSNLFRPSQPLGSFSVNIDIAYFMGVYSSQARADLIRIKNIRNKFAHDAHASSFDDPKIANDCRNLHFVEKFVSYKDNYPEVVVPLSNGDVGHAVYGPDADMLGTLRQRFFTSCQFFVEILIGTYPGGRTHSPHF